MGKVPAHVIACCGVLRGRPWMCEEGGRAGEGLAHVAACCGVSCRDGRAERGEALGGGTVVSVD